MRTFIYLLFALTAIQIPAQNRIQGKMLDAVTSEALPGATIYSSDKKNFGVSAANGFFELKAPRTGDSVFVRLLGYKPVNLLYKGDSVLNIFLTVTPNAMEEVVVTASRDKELISNAPVSLEKINAQTISQMKPMLLTEVLNKATGVVMLNLNNEQHGMSIRQPMGTSPYYLYMEDGIPLRTMGVFNHNALIETNLFSISSIEIVKGPASSLYGPEAVGGAINFITQKPTAVTTVKAGFQADNFGYKRIQFASGGMISKNLGYSIGGYKAQQKNGWMSYSDYDKQSLNARLDYALGKRSILIFSGSYNDYYSQTPGAVDSVAFYQRTYQSPSPFTYRQVMAARLRGTLEHRWNNTQSSNIHIFYRDNLIGQDPSYAIKWVKGSANAMGEINENRFTSRGFIAQHVALFPIIKTKVIAGISSDYSPVTYQAYRIDLAAKLRPGGQSVEEYSIVSERPEISLVNYKANLSNSAAYIQTEVNPVAAVFITMGYRFDVMSFQYKNYLDQSTGVKTYQRGTPKLGATYKINANARVYGNFSQGFSPPGLTSIFTRVPGGGPSDFYYDLQPAQFNNFELGGSTDIIRNKVNLNVTVYEMDGKNELLNVRLPDNSTDLRSAGKTIHKGIEYTATARLSHGVFIKAGGSNAIHQYREFILSTRSQDAVQDVNGKIMPSAPSWMMNAEVFYQPPFIKGFRIGAEWFHLSSWYQNQVNTSRYEDTGLFGLKGISVVNVRTGYQWKAVELFINVMNISNELYAFNATRGNSPGSAATYTPAPPRSFVFGIQYNFIQNNHK